jgi:glycosyltransferase involved in cell wall biosynthesis
VVKVGFILFTDLRSLKGDAVHVKNLLKEFEKSDLRVDAIAGRPAGNRVKLKHFTFLVQVVNRLAFLMRILALRKRYDMLYLRDWLFAYLLSFCKARYAFEVNGLLPYEGLIRNYFQPGSVAHRCFQRIEKRVLHSAAKIVSVSYPIKQYCVDDVGVDERKIIVAENAADTDVFNPDAPKKQIQPKDSKTLIGWMGSFESQHGFDDFIAIAMRLRDRKCHDVAFLIIGGGPAKEELEQHLSELGLKDYFLFCGQVPWNRVPGYMLNVDFCLSLYRRTPANLQYRAKTGAAQIKIFEYLALGKPILAYDHGDAREFFEARKIGWVCQMDPENVADKVIEIIQDPNQINEYAQNALALSRQRYNWKVTAAKIVDFLKERE